MIRTPSTRAGAALLLGLLAAPAAEATCTFCSPRIAVSVPMAQPLEPTVMSLGWQPFGTATERYVVVRDGRTIGSSTGTGYIDQTAVAGATYVYDVYAEKKNVFTWGGSISATAPPLGPVIWQTTFEENAVGSGTYDIGGWFRTAHAPELLTITTEKARAGGKSAKFDFRKTNWANDDDGFRLQLDQTESGALGQRFRTTFPLDTVMWVGWSMFIDPSWLPDVEPHREILFQFHGQTGGPGRGTPPLTIFGHADQIEVNFAAASSGSTAITCASAAPSSSALSSTPLTGLRGKWTDWVFKVKFSYTTGTIDVWRDGAHVVAFTGQTIWKCDDGGDTPGPMWEAGVYKWNWGLLVPPVTGVPSVVTTRLMYADEIRIGDSTATCADVKPTGAPACAP